MKNKFQEVCENIDCEDCPIYYLKVSCKALESISKDSDSQEILKSFLEEVMERTLIMKKN